MKKVKISGKNSYHSIIEIGRIIMILFFIMSVLLCLIPPEVLAATTNGMSYSGKSYYAINKYGVNMRDAKGNLITYISSGHGMKVLGVYSSDTTRAVVEYNGKIGHVLKGGLNNVKNKYPYTVTTEEGYIVKNEEALNFRDQNYKKIQTISAGSEMTVLGKYEHKTYTDRVVVIYKGVVGTVLNTGLIKEKTETEIEEENSNQTSVDGYWAWTSSGLNMRKESKSSDTLGEFIEYLPAKSLVWVNGVDKTDSTRCNITFNGSNGTILKGGLKKVSSSQFIPFTEGNKSYKYAVTGDALNMRTNTDTDGDGTKDFIETLKKYTAVYVLGVSKEETNRLVVVWNGKIGTILNNVSTVNDAAHVSIKLQKTTLFKNGKILVQSDCVTAKEGVYETPVGKWSVLTKFRNIPLPAYNVDNVEYWIGFTNRSHGFHDASWRSSFGGSIYKTNGSHGCVNLPLEKVREIYNNITIGTTVYVSAT